MAAGTVDASGGGILLTCFIHHSWICSVERSQLCRLLLSDRIRCGHRWPLCGLLVSILPEEAPRMDHMRKRTGYRCVEYNLRRRVHLRTYTRDPIERPNVLRPLSCADTDALRGRFSLLCL